MSFKNFDNIKRRYPYFSLKIFYNVYFCFLENDTMKTKLILVALMLFSINMIAEAQTKQDKGTTTVVVTTEYGEILIKLYNETPLHKENFIKLIKEGYYNDLLFHRLIKGFMIQGGDPNSKNASPGEMLGQGGPGYTVPAEILPQYFHKKGVLAAARKGDNVNPGKASSGSQFYIVQGKVYTKEELSQFVIQNKHKAFTEEEIAAYTTVGGTPHLDGGYTVFGEVVKGMEVLEKLMNEPTDSYDRPVKDIKFTIKLK